MESSLSKSKYSGINETSVESIVFAVLGAIACIPAFFIAPVVFNGLGFAFCALGIVLAIFALIDMLKQKKTEGLVTAIIGIVLAIAVVVVIVVVRQNLGISVMLDTLPV